MAGILLVLFPILLMFDARLAVASLVLAIVLLYCKRASSARRIVRRPVDHF